MEKFENIGSKLTNTNVISNGVENASECTEGMHQVGVSSIPVCVNTDTHNEFASASHTREQTCLLYDRRVNGIEEKFINSILHDTGSKRAFVSQNSPIFRQWQKQSGFSFRFIPHSEQVMPDVVNTVSPVGLTVFDIHALVRATGKHNYMSARIPVRSQLNVSVWKEELSNYWDQQLLQLLEFGFPLDFNRQCPLRFEGENHTSATDYPADIDAYIQEERHFDAILGPFKESPIKGGHCSPFMTKYKPNSDRCRVIIDLRWPLGASVNAGIDKNTYLGSDFELTFPSVDEITNALKCFGRGAFLYKVDVSRAFHHIQVDPGDYNLLGLQWNGTYIDTCLLFGKRHGSQIFQCLSDAVCYIMRQNGHLAIKLFAFKWEKCNIRVRCDNQAVVQVLRSGRTTDPFLAACTCNIWFWATQFDADMRYNHIQGVNNRVAALLS